MRIQEHGNLLDKNYNTEIQDVIDHCIVINKLDAFTPFRLSVNFQCSIHHPLVSSNHGEVGVGLGGCYIVNQHWEAFRLVGHMR